MLKGAISIFTSIIPEILGKTYRLGVSGLEKSTAGEMVESHVEVAEFGTASDLCSVLSGVSTHQAISSSLPNAAPAKVVTRKNLSKQTGAISRTKEFFSFPAGQPGLLILDYDPPPDGAAMQRDDLWRVLRTVAPNVTGAGVVWWSSGSSHIFNGEHELQGLRGQRLYVMVADLSDVPRAAKVLGQMLWLQGFGRVQVSTSGQKLLRHTFDEAMHQPARLDFCGGAVTSPPLSQRRSQPVVLSNGGFLDTRAVFPDPDIKSSRNFESVVEAAKAKAEPEAQLKRDQWKSGRLQVESLRLVKAGLNVAEANERAERTLSSALRGVLLGDFEIQLDDGDVVTIGEVLDKRERYHNALTRDPLEPDYLNSKTVGKLFLFGVSPVLHSMAHGGCTYKLIRQPERIYLVAGRRAAVADDLISLLSKEPDIFTRGGVLVVSEPEGLRPIKRAAGLSYEVGRRFALCRHTDKGDVPADLDDATANMVFAALGVL